MYKPPMKTLVETAEDLFLVERGGLLKSRPGHPVITFKGLVCKVARDKGYTTTTIGKALGIDRTTVTHHVVIANKRLKDGAVWWLHAKGRLVDAWEEAMGDQWSL